MQHDKRRVASLIPYLLTVTKMNIYIERSPFTSIFANGDLSLIYMRVQKSLTFDDHGTLKTTDSV